MSRYSDDFYRAVGESARRSAEAVVPLVTELVRPRSVVDVGSGSGEWLAVFREHGAHDLVAVDAPAAGRRLAVPEATFVAHDLARPLRLDGRRFDLVVSLEVAEHLPSSAAATFVDSLTGLGPAVLFSAAIPGQGGTSHVNEQWPAYWADLFAARGYAAFDCVRLRVWDDPRVDFWYAQNTLLYLDEDAAAALPDDARRTRVAAPPALVHPALYEKRALAVSPRAVAKTLLRALQLRRSRR